MTSDTHQKPNQNKNPFAPELLITGNSPVLWSALSQTQLGTCKSQNFGDGMEEGGTQVQGRPQLHHKF